MIINAKGQRGFSLVELLAAMGVTVLLLASVVPLLHMGLRVWNEQLVAVTKQQDERVVLELIARELRRAKRSEVKIMENTDDAAHPGLQFAFSEGAGQITHRYYQQGIDLQRRRDTEAGSIVSPILSDIDASNGFEFSFYNTVTRERAKEAGSTLGSSEVVELIIRANRNGQVFEVRTFAQPRND